MLPRAAYLPTLTRATLTPVTESGIYTEADLRPYQSRLAELKQIITAHNQPEDEDDAAREAALTKLLMTKWEVCGEWRPHTFSIPPNPTRTDDVVVLLNFCLKIDCSPNLCLRCLNFRLSSLLCISGSSLSVDCWLPSLPDQDPLRQMSTQS